MDVTGVTQIDSVWIWDSSMALSNSENYKCQLFIKWRNTIRVLWCHTVIISHIFLFETIIQVLLQINLTQCSDLFRKCMELFDFITTEMANYFGQNIHSIHLFNRDIQWISNNKIIQTNLPHRWNMISVPRSLFLINLKTPIYWCNLQRAKSIGDIESILSSLPC